MEAIGSALHSTSRSKASSNTGSAELSWFKFSYSDSSGSACLEVAYTWRKSSYSDSQGGECIEVAACPHTIHVRDTKLGARSPRFAVHADAWTPFVAYASREA